MFSETSSELRAPLHGACQAWLNYLGALTEEEGWLEPVGRSHHSLHLDRGPVLLVCFDQLDTLAAQPIGQMPAAWQLAEAEGWSVLSLICEDDSWYRDPSVWRHIDRLVDDSFFEDFDSVLFYGAGAGAAHAACAFSVAAPGAAVLALGPVATLDPRISGWDHRWPGLRRADFRSRYGYGPDMIKGAAAVTLIHDPEIPEDAMHATLYRQDGVALLKARGAGANAAGLLEQVGILDTLLRAAQSRSLTPALWAKLWRARRGSTSWLQSRATRAADAGHSAREAVCLAHALRLAPDQPRLRRRYDALCATLQIAAPAD